MVKAINESEFSEVKEKDIALVDFNATWCGPCKMLSPILTEVSNDYDDKVDFYSIDVDNNQDLALEYGVQSIPTLLILKKGAEISRQVGFIPKPQLKGFLDAALK